MSDLLKIFYNELKDHLKNCYSNDGACHWKTPLLKCQCDCKFCENFRRRIEFMNVNVLPHNQIYSELRYHSFNHMPLITAGNFKNCDDQCWTYRFDKEEIKDFAKRCIEMEVIIECKLK